ncbi:hypothetical protein BDP55DRAFT_655588 [Colletotrichum godetiae]|uniref:Uncharacterized protein n=1 Tax=Colletotrichum godetiae TaxID=1209918 RepID=A0AAJ0AR95_9PEZI|nr:uncharacterized protein BDP55DRAFT_655588 [Colletotrichum godetiae]KAK1688911.1 hypothetical protein BDP55DRAFT_655588 [Colletotrichum godetiae]
MMIRLHWFTVHGVYLLTQFALLVAGFVAFVSTPLVFDHPMPPGVPWGAFALSGFSLFANGIIVSTVFSSQQPNALMTDESRMNIRRAILLVSALFAASFAAADWAFAVSLRKYGSIWSERAASGVAGVASFVALAALVVDIWKICADASEARSAELFDQEQLNDVEPFIDI